MVTPKVRRVIIDLSPLIVGIMLLLVPLVVTVVIFFASLGSASHKRISTHPPVIEVTTHVGLWGGYWLPVIGLLLIAFWLGRVVGRRTTR